MIKTKYLFEKRQNQDIVLMHLLTFDIFVITGDNAVAWMKNNIQLMSEDTKYLLRKRRFLIDSKMSDDSLLIGAYHNFSQRKLKVPNIVIYLTNRCNLRCSYCYTGYEHEAQYEYITFSDIDKIFDAIEIIYKKNKYLDEKPNISLFGGEPLLKPNMKLVQYIVEKLNKEKYNHFEIVTNLINIEDYLSILKEFKLGHISFRVTINGDRTLHDSLRKFPNGKGTYDITFENIKIVLNELPYARIDLSILIEKSIDSLKIQSLFLDFKKNGFLDNPRIKIRFGHIQFRSKYICPGFENRVIDTSDYYPMLYELKKQNLLITDDMIEGSSMYLLNQIYRSFNNANNVAVPNFLGCDAIYPGRFCFFTDGKVYPCFDCVGMKGYEIADYRNSGLEFYDSYILCNVI